MDRKADARKKAQLGNLMVMVGFDHLYPDDLKILYGMLLWAKKAMEGNPNVIMPLWKRKGHKMLTGVLKEENKAKYQEKEVADFKQETRKKICIGGLFVKAGLDYMHPKETYVLYGMLVWCKEAFYENYDIVDMWQKRGKALDESAEMVTDE